MSDQQSQASLESLGSRIEELEAQIKMTLERSQKRARVVTTLVVILGIVLAGYLGFAYSQLSTIDSQVVVDGARQQVKGMLRDSEGDLVKAVNARAPELMAQAEKAALAVPAQARVWFRDYFNEQLAAGISDHETKLVPIMQAELQKLAQRHKDLSSAEKTKAAIDDIGNTYRKRSIEAVDEVYGGYSKKIGEVAIYLDELGEGEGLDDRQKIQRQLFQTFFAMIAKWDNGKKKTVSMITN
ncbi:MAG: hypothetical protein OER86_06825 [Phycisphaerae bacterium]|nr:hypothetical protein [Phycisphaerae bacterium]